MYIERRPPAALAGLVTCTWEQTEGARRTQLVVPDGCTDILWSGERLFLAGPDTAARQVAIGAGQRIVGIRFAPGTARTVLGLPLAELRDQGPDVGDVLGAGAAERLLERLLAGAEPHRQLGDAVSALRRTAPDPLVGAAVRRLRRPRTLVTPLAGELGISDRQLRRRFDVEVGYAPKVLARVLRFQRLLTLADARGPSEGLAALALDAGYADQAHMTTEVSRLAGCTPARLLGERWHDRFTKDDLAAAA